MTWRKKSEEIGRCEASADGGINVSMKCVIDALCMFWVAKPYLGVVKINPRLADLVPT
jgi:hypothetical protein